MRPARVRLVDLGFEHDFDTSMAFAQSLIQALVTRWGDDPVAEIEFIRTRDFWTVAAALQNPAHVIHVIAHGEAGPDDLGFWSDDDTTTLSLTELAEAFAADGQGIEASVLFADCCGTAQGRFTKAIRNCIEQPIAYIGSRRNVNWHESTTFASAFYGAYFRDRGRGLPGPARGLRAAERAIDGYKAIVDGPCPFVASELTPSRRALKTLGH